MKGGEKNMNTKKLLYGISAIALTVIIGSIVAGSAYAYQGDYTKKGPNYTPERHTAMEKAFDNNDYNAWKNLMVGRGRVTQVITKDNFAKFAQAHKLAEQGKYAEADAVRKELGLMTQNGQRMGTGFGQGMGMHR
ncbi:hypothetical protein COY90_00075 [Candidatus Roizmanbacteria bacterium CG_4_10_14_0_8_um_filter_39_9]|uniref:Uncharacterized protein n=1 Tax=Candidatus Roizmanbacteria bacterium CG_4_10_14_0_8_um_filter_39_9 TaxID=1974829 RepID=A0A2M7QEA0_9BACT|nr:MAG: hypothetical protein COY90_00075 [Candidatus Roizmanbacteria bacterium CG_4_10_14_0_8_um_filter_39_9]